MSDLILVIEDDEDCREVVCELLDERGFEVVAARSARLGMSVLQAGVRPGLILLDIRMAGFNGLDFRRAQLADDALRDIPTIAMTAGLTTLASAPELPWTAILPKPLDVRQLVEAVVAALAPARRAAGAAGFAPAPLQAR